MSENTAGFYKYEEPLLHYGQNYVLAPEYELFKETKDDNAYPIDGWYWFDTIEDALAFFDIPESIVKESEMIEKERAWIYPDGRD